MQTHVDKSTSHKSTTTVQKKTAQENPQITQIPALVAQRKLQAMANGSEKVAQLKSLQHLANQSNQAKSLVQLQQMANQKPAAQGANKTGMPDQLKSGIEHLSGYNMDDVQVHYNSSKPAALHAHAYAQGSDIHLGAGQEKHLPHEAWHVVQQKQGRVKPTLQMKGGVDVNDDKGLEREADVMGNKATKL